MRRGQSKGYVGSYDPKKPLLVGYKGFRVIDTEKRSAQNPERAAKASEPSDDEPERMPCPHQP